MDTNTTIHIPESVHFYFSQENYNRQRMLKFSEIKANELPNTFTFDDTVEFYKAKASIEICKMALFQFMTGVFQKTWGNALANNFIALDQEGLSAKNIPDLENINAACTPDSVFKQSECNDVQCNYVYWYYKHKNNNNRQYTLYIGCSTYKNNDETKLYLSFYFYDGSEWIYFEKIKETLLQSPYWEGEGGAESGFDISEEHALPIQDTLLDVEPLAKIARETLSALIEHYKMV